MEKSFWMRCLRLNTFMNKLIASYIILITLVIFLIGILFYSGTNYQMQEDVRNTAISTLRQTIRSTDLIMGEIDRASIRLVSNENVYSFMNSQETGSYSYAQNLVNLRNTLFNLKTTSNYIHSIYIYSALRDRVFSSEAAIVDASLYQDAGIMKDMLAKDLRTLRLGTRRFDADSFAVDPSLRQNVISFFRSYPIDGSENKGVIQINISESTFYNLLRDLFPDNKGMIMIINEKGVIISHNNKKMLYEDVSDEKYIKKIMSGLTEGFLFDKIDGEQYAIFYSTPENSTWKYIAAVPVSKYMSSINLIKSSILLLCTVVLVIGVTLAFFLARMNYKPIRNFINMVRSGSKQAIDTSGTRSMSEIQELSEVFNELYLKKNILEDQVSSNLNTIRQKFLLDYFHNKAAEEENLLDYQYFKEKFRYPYFVVISFFVEKKTQQNIKELIDDTFKGEFNEYISELVQQNIQEYFIILNYWKYPQVEEILGGKIAWLQTRLEDALTITTGSVVTSFDEIFISYDEAVEARKYRITMGNKQPIFYDRLVEKKSAAYYELFSYIDTMMEATKSLDLQVVQQGMEPFFHAVKSDCIPYEFIQQLYVQIYSRLFTFLRDYGIYNEDFMVKEKNVYQKFKQFYDIEEIEMDIVSAIHHAIQLVLEKKKSNKYRSVIQKIQTLILQEIENPDMSLQYLADQVDLSVSFLSKVFKEETGENFIDYMIRVRIDRAKKLLEDCSLPIGRVCERVGYVNIHSFIRTFKKYTGFTPGAYREKLIAERLNAAAEDLGENDSPEDSAR